MKKTYTKLVAGLQKTLYDKDIPAVYMNIGNREDIAVEHTPKPEEKPIPFAFASIGDRNKDIGSINEIWDRAIPLSKYNPNTIGPDMNTAARKKQFQFAEAVHNSLLDEHKAHIVKNDVQHNVSRYTQDSNELNMFLIGMHKKQLDPTNWDHVRQHHKELTESGELRYTAPEIMDWHENLSHVLQTAPRLKTNVEVYTGIGAGFEVNRLKHENNGIIHFPAYTSTSLDPRIAQNFAVGNPKRKDTKPFPEVVRFRLNRGDNPGLYIAGHSMLDHEREYLMKSGINARILGEPRIYTDVTGSRYMLHDAEIHND